VGQALRKVPEDALNDEERKLRDELMHLPEVMNRVSFTSKKAYEGHAKDYSGTSMHEHWQSGYEDTRRTLKPQECMTMPPPGSEIDVRDVHRETD
jgi:NTE family protein